MSALSADSHRDRHIDTRDTCQGAEVRPMSPRHAAVAKTYSDKPKKYVDNIAFKGSRCAQHLNVPLNQNGHASSYSLYIHSTLHMMVRIAGMSFYSHCCVNVCGFCEPAQQLFTGLGCHTLSLLFFRLHLESHLEGVPIRVCVSTVHVPMHM